MEVINWRSVYQVFGQDQMEVSKYQLEVMQCQLMAGECLYKMPISVGVLLRGQNQRVASISGGKNQFKINISWSLVSIGGQYHNKVNWFSIKMVVIPY